MLQELRTDSVPVPAHTLGNPAVLQISPFLLGALPPSLCPARTHLNAGDAQQLPRLFLHLQPGH